jgi:hypothetical protein
VPDSLSEQIATELAILLEPLESALATPQSAERLLRYLGSPPLLDVVGLTQLAQDVGAVRVSLVALTQMERDEIGGALVAAGQDAWALLETIMAVADDGVSVDPDVVDDVVAALARLPHFLVVRWLERRAAALLLLLRFIGVADRRDDPIETLHLDRFEAFLAAPLDALADLYSWGEGQEWDSGRLLDILDATLSSIGLVARWGSIPTSWQDNGLISPTHPSVTTASVLKAPLVALRSSTGRVIHQGGLMIGPLGSTPTAPLDGAFITLWSSFTNNSIQIGPVDLEVPVDLDAPTIGVRLKPRGIEPVGALADTLRLGVSFRDPIDIGPAAAPDVRIANVGAAIEIGSDGRSFAVEAGGDVTILMGFGGADALISSALGAITLDASLGFRYDTTAGLSLNLAAGIEVIIVPPKIPGPLQLDLLTVRIEFAPDALSGRVLVNARAELGILTLVVAGVGFEANTTLAAPPTVGLAFVPPTGIGIGVDIGPVKGGGFLDIDAPAGRYSGVLQLEVLSVGISAIALIETKRPDIDGWSMLFALFIELPNINLGFGFTLNGVGGLAGIQRTIDVDGLQAAVRGGALGSILFPEDPIADAPMIISTLESIFPPAADSYVFGPMVKIGWGTPTIVEAELGIVIAFPDLVIAVLGSVTAVLPRPELELVALRLDVAGIIDVGSGTLSIDASLHDSHIVGFALAGDMALRADFSDGKAFLFSLGGFHPGFDPPPGFPTLARLSLGINAGSVVSVSFRCYAAITSNTVQFGAAFDLWAKAMGFEVAGGTSFDALIQFSPFQVRASVGFYISVSAVGVNLLGVYLNATLIGPNPWNVVGTAEFKVLGITKDFRVDETIGQRSPEPPAVAPDLVEAAVRELDLDGNWEVVASGSGSVVFAEAADEADSGVLRVRPDATIEVRQGIVPFGERIEKYGNAELDGQHTFELEPQGGLQRQGDTTDWFAPGHYFDFKPKERLAQPSFALFTAGIRFGSDALLVGSSHDLPEGHAEFIVDPEAPDAPPRLAAPRTSAVPRSPRAVRGFAVTVDDQYEFADVAWARGAVLAGTNA